MSKIVYDSGALIAAERRDPRIWALHAEELDSGEAPLVPSTALAQVWRNGAKQISLSRLLKGCSVVPLDEQSAREVGAILALDASSDIVDAHVAILVTRAKARVVATSDPDDIVRLLRITPGPRHPVDIWQT